MRAYTLREIAGNIPFTDSMGRVWKLRIRSIADLFDLEDDLAVLFTNSSELSIDDIMLFVASNTIGEKHGDFPVQDFEKFVEAIISGNFDPKKKPDDKADDVEWPSNMMYALLDAYGMTPTDIIGLTMIQLHSIFRGAANKSDQDYIKGSNKLPKELMREIEGLNKAF